MSATTATQPGTDKAGLRKHISLARRGDPVHVAFALGADGKAILSMDRRRQPRVLEKALKADAADAKHHRFGTMIIDPERPGVARLTVNRAAGGMARKLVAALKGSGVKQVELLLEDGTPIESAENEEDETDGPADMWEDDAPAEDAETRDQDGGEAASDDVRRAEGELAGLVRRVMTAVAADPTRKAALTEMATDARAALTRGDLDGAEAGLDVLRMALGDGAAPAGGRADGAAKDNAHATAGRYRKSRAAWLKTREKVDADIRKLQAAIMATNHGGAFGDDLEGQFLSAVDPILDTLDTSLSDILSDAENADGEEAERLLASARGTVGMFRTFVAGNDTIRHLDQNPFVPVAIGKTLQASLEVLAAALR